MMTIEQREVTVGEMVDGYTNSEEQGVRGYGGKLDIRPPYQREFIYDEREQQAVVRTVLRGYPMGVMYWVRRSDDAECPYEVMDVQQRILRYPLTVYVCRGEPSEKLEWFRTINIAGKPLNEQEIRNAVYAGPFVSDAKCHFSKAACAAYRLGKDLVPGVPIRQDLLRRALEWMADHETRLGRPGTAVGYMARHQHDPNANPLWSYFQAACEHFGCGSVTQTTDANAVLQALSEGRPVISSQGPGLFTSAGHFIVLRGLTADGKVLVNDPNDSDTKNYVNRAFDMMTEIHATSSQYWIFDKK